MMTTAVEMRHLMYARQNQIDCILTSGELDRIVEETLPHIKKAAFELKERYDLPIDTLKRDAAYASKPIPKSSHVSLAFRFKSLGYDCRWDLCRVQCDKCYHPGVLYAMRQLLTCGTADEKDAPCSHAVLSIMW